MSTTIEIHRQAMEFANKGLIARERGDTSAYLQFTQQAFELEKEAAMRLITKFDAQPTRTVLFRSAATLALNASLYDEAKKLAYLGMAGNPYKQLADELNDVLVQAIEKESHTKEKEYPLSEMKPTLVLEPEGDYDKKEIPKIPLFFIGFEKAKERIDYFLNSKYPILSKLTGKDDTSSVWYSQEHISQLYEEMKYLNANGLRVYFGAYGPNDYSFAGQTCLIMIPTRFNEHTSSNDNIILEYEPDFFSRTNASKLTTPSVHESEISGIETKPISIAK